MGGEGGDNGHFNGQLLQPYEKKTGGFSHFKELSSNQILSVIRLGRTKHGHCHSLYIAYTRSEHTHLSSGDCQTQHPWLPRRCSGMAPATDRER